MSNLPEIAAESRKSKRPRTEAHGVLVKGDLAPPHFPVMSINNPGGIYLGFFESSRFLFVQMALADLSADHYDSLHGSQHVLQRSSVQCSWEITSLTPRSDRYYSLVQQLLTAKIVCRLSDLQAVADHHRVLNIVILSLFAVVKDLPPTPSCRPIENGRPVKSQTFKSGFSLPGASRLTQILLRLNTSGWVAAHGDLQNYYFQIPLSSLRSLQHAFVVHAQIYCWLCSDYGLV
jgi:hypothetical protein